MLTRCAPFVFERPMEKFDELYTFLVSLVDDSETPALNGALEAIRIIDEDLWAQLQEKLNTEHPYWSR